MALDLQVILGFLDKTEAGYRAQENRMESLAKKGQQLGKAMTIAGAAITGSLLAATHSAAQYGDELAKASAKTGISTEALSKLRFAAEQTGTEFGAMTGSMARLQRAALDASNGMKTQQEAFARMGVEVKDASGELKATDVLFTEIAQGLSEMENDTERAATAMQVFGRSGVNMLPLLNAGAEGIEKLSKRAEELGIVWSGEAALAAENYNDALNEVKLAATGLGQTLVVTLGPAITETAEKVAEIIAKFSAWAKENPGLAEGLAKAALALGLVLSVVGPILVILPSLVGGINIVTAAFTRQAGAATAAAVASKAALGGGAASGAGAAAAGAGAASGGGAIGAGVGVVGTIASGVTAASTAIGAAGAVAAVGGAAALDYALTDKDRRSQYFESTKSAEARGAPAEEEAMRLFAESRAKALAGEKITARQAATGERDAMLIANRVAERRGFPASMRIENSTAYFEEEMTDANNLSQVAE